MKNPNEIALEIDKLFIRLFEILGGGVIKRHETPLETKNNLENRLSSDDKVEEESRLIAKIKALSKEYFN